MILRIADDNWADGSAYDAYMGRWSQAVARAFLEWLAPAPRLRWLDVGCGTGVLSQAVIQYAHPERVTGCDPSAAFIQHARDRIQDERLSFMVGTLDDLPLEPGGFDALVSGLVLNFVLDPVEAVQRMMARARVGAHIAAYVWDYAGGMDFLRIFWETAAALDTAGQLADEGKRFPICQPERLESTFQQAGLSRVTTGAVEIPTVFVSFPDYWEPFLAGIGAAPAYVASLSASQRDELAARLKQRLAPAGGGRIELMARAWTVRGEVG
jgi:SAM-dependent methyltransferase